MNTRRLTDQGSDAEVASVVLVCTVCHHTWEPHLLDPTDRVALASTGCPLCGGWTWIGQITEPGERRMQPTTPRDPQEHNPMKATPTTDIATEGVPAMVDAALDRLRAEQKRACQLLADGWWTPRPHGCLSPMAGISWLMRSWQRHV